MTTVLFSVFLLASGAAAATSTPAMSAEATPVTTAANETAKAERKICKREMNTESRMGSKRICLTAAQWKARQGNGVTGIGGVAK